jgi:hypothetical protein
VVVVFYCPVALRTSVLPNWFAYQPKIALRDDRPTEQDVYPGITVDRTWAGNNLPVDSVPVQHYVKI